jgi:hypothetical protein
MVVKVVMVVMVVMVVLTVGMKASTSLRRTTWSILWQLAKQPSSLQTP